MNGFQAPNPDFINVVKTFAKSIPTVEFFGFQLTEITAGKCEIVQPYREDLSQGTGLFTGVVMGVIAEFSGGFAAATLLPVGWAAMTVDYTIKILAPGKGEKLIGRGEVIRPGKQTSCSRADVFAVKGDQETLCATALITMRNIPTSS